jgi:hypothetical protein
MKKWTAAWPCRRARPLGLCRPPREPGAGPFPLARTPLDEDAAVAAMRNVYNPGDTHV